MTDWRSSIWTLWDKIFSNTAFSFVILPLVMGIAWCERASESRFYDLLGAYPINQSKEEQGTLKFLGNRNRRANLRSLHGSIPIECGGRIAPTYCLEDLPRREKIAIEYFEYRNSDRTANIVLSAKSLHLKPLITKNQRLREIRRTQIQENRSIFEDFIFGLLIGFLISPISYWVLNKKYPRYREDNPKFPTG